MTRAIALGPRASALRRDLGPVAWCALECLVERSDDGRTTTASIRAIASDLGVAKNTAHRAVALLVRAGLAEAVQDRESDGRFLPGHYRLHLDGVVTTATTTASTRRPHRARPITQPTATTEPAQLTLLTPA